MALWPSSVWLSKFFGFFFFSCFFCIVWEQKIIRDRGNLTFCNGQYCWNPIVFFSPFYPVQCCRWTSLWNQPDGSYHSPPLLQLVNTSIIKKLNLTLILNMHSMTYFTLKFFTKMYRHTSFGLNTQKVIIFSILKLKKIFCLLDFRFNM